ncbi:MAG: hypothetical protein D6816_14230 [Bacteroidetes bacterium]|nr:MAG: hypothetical protein D6816_14230 [Bacteroidota bacterium]
MSKSENGNQWYTYVLAVVLLAAAVFLIYRNLTSSGGPSSKYFYNLETKELITLPVDTLSPHTLENGQVAVEALVQACGSCDSESDREIVYLMKYSDAAYELKNRYPEQVPIEEAGPLMRPDAQLISTPELAAKNVWYPLASPKGNQISQIAMGTCGDGTPKKVCLP